MAKTALRHQMILELIAGRAIATQEELAAALEAAGFAVTQSSVSRDIAALRLVKSGGAYRRAELPAPRGNPDERHIAEGITAGGLAGDCLIVLHTPPGEANRVAVSLDRLAWPGIAGTLAGDDTIFLATKNRAAQSQVLRRLRKLTRRVGG
jgi:transcriptional regulator of arginine metabolism